MYNPDPFYDLGVHDWMEDEFGAVTALTFFGHATQTMIDPSTPETIVRDYAWKMMNICMARQYRGPHEFFMDDFIAAIEAAGYQASPAPQTPDACPVGPAAQERNRAEGGDRIDRGDAGENLAVEPVTVSLVVDEVIEIGLQTV